MSTKAKDIPRRVRQLADKTSTYDMDIMEQLQELKEGQEALRTQTRDGFNAVNTRLDSLEQEVFGLRTGLNGMRSDLNNAFARNNELLEMLVENTRKA